MRFNRWEHLDCDDEQVKTLEACLGVDPVVARLLCLRDIADPDKARRFLKPTLQNLYDPFALTDLPKAVDILSVAIDQRVLIAVHGDYDVDGVMATVMLRRALELFGGNVIHFIPERMKDGYGLQSKAIDRLHSKGVRLIVSVDCGIRSNEAARRARDLGIDLIVTDHHEPGMELPEALCVINPKRHDCSYPDKNLAGVGVALKLVQGLCSRNNHNEWLPRFLKIAAIGTLADVVPLIGENRVIAKVGLEELSQGSHTLGLRILLEKSGLLGKSISESDISFSLAPKINAAGRMATPELAARLLLMSDETMSSEALDLVQQLGEENRRRKYEEGKIFSKARRSVETDPSIGSHSMLVVSGEQWHRGVIGIIASKLVDVFHRPAVVFSIDGDLAYGSARSIPGFDVLSALEKCSDLLVQFGGHKQAAGLTLKSTRIKDFRSCLVGFADEILGPDELTPRLRIDAKLSLDAITANVVNGVSNLAPFGIGNPRPIFRANGVEIVRGPYKLKEKHLKLSVKQNRKVFRAIAWRSAEKEEFLKENRSSLDVAFSLTENTYRGETFVELEIADVKKCR